ncbi:MAG: histidine kinase [Butyrivibrio sp.]|jgi:two-component sensor histidine kinase|nr:histidine kinase [Butyrivibrio sp.]
MSVTSYINASLELWGSVMSIFIILCLFLEKRISEKCDRFFLYMLICNTAASLSDVAALFTRGHSGAGYWWSVRLFNFSSFSINYLLVICFTCYLTLYLSKQSKVSLMPLRLSIVSSLISEILLIINQFIPIIYYIDSHNIYHRAALFWLSQIGPLLCLVFDSILLILHRKRLAPQEICPLWVYLLLPVSALTIQSFIYGLVLQYCADTIALILIFLFLQIDQTRVMAEQENKLTQAKVAIMMSQIQPHFLFNSLAVIQELCHGKAPEAEAATIEFAEYLRGNLDSLTTNVPILFRRELEHTGNYLALEKRRFGDKLTVRYDIHSDNFMIPALTLEPIAENAVRNGLMKKEAGGTLSISTCEDSENIMIIIEDDGIGFDPDTIPQDGRSHIGISNVRSRLADMCHGSLTITSTPGKGTRAVITIPKDPATAPL